MIAAAQKTRAKITAITAHIRLNLITNIFSLRFYCF